MLFTKFSMFINLVLRVAIEAVVLLLEQDTFSIFSLKNLLNLNSFLKLYLLKKKKKVKGKKLEIKWQSFFLYINKRVHC
jgi:hypothetical protein